MGLVFDSVDRQSRSPAPNSESTFDAINRLGGAFWTRIRMLIEDWVARIADDETRSDVIGRLRSRDDDTFQGAFLELYCHELLLRSGFQLECHPRLPGTSRRPDFKATNDEGDSFILEATTANESRSARADERRLNQVLDALDQIGDWDFFLFVRVIKRGTQVPTVRRLRPQLQVWLRSLDADALALAMSESSSNLTSPLTPRHTWKHDGWELEFLPVPKRAEKRGTSSNLVGMHSAARLEWVNDAAMLRGRLQDKGRAYGRLHQPFVIALTSANGFLDMEDGFTTLYGSLAVQFSVTPTGDVEGSEGVIRNRDGYWYGPEGLRRSQVSAVLLVTNLQPWSVAATIPVAWYHPMADHPITLPPICKEVQLNPNTGESLVTEAAEKPTSYFNLPPKWPGPESAFENGS